MKSKQRLTVPLVLCFCAFCFAASGQDSVTAQKLIDRFIRVSLGKLSADSIKATSFKAAGTHNGDSFEVYILKETPGKEYMKYTSLLQGSFEIIYNGGRAIYRAVGKTVPLEDSLMLEGMGGNTYLLTDMSYGTLGYTMRLVPPGPSEAETYKVELVSPRGAKTFKYYDKATGYLKKSVQPDGSVTVFSDYFTHDGFTTNRREQGTSADGSTSDFIVTEALINPRYDPSLFNF